MNLDSFKDQPINATGILHPFLGQLLYVSGGFVLKCQNIKVRRLFYCSVNNSGLYIISVDDCFFAEKREEMEAQIYSEMTVEFSPFISVLSSKEYTNEVNTILEMLELGIDASIVIQSLIEKLEIEDIKKCYELCPKSNTSYYEEKNAIMAFLEEMKSNGIIKKYITFSSVSEANLFDVKIAGMTDGAVLWLVDRNFLRVGESADAGLLLAENLAKRTDGVDRYVYVLSAVNEDSKGSEDEIELEFDKVLAEKCSAETHSFIYYINKGSSSACVK